MTITDTMMFHVFMDAADPILIEDPHGIIIEANHKACALYGWSREKLLGQPITALIPTTHHPMARRLLQRCLDGQDVQGVETRRVTSTGEESVVLVTLSALRDESGEVTAIANMAKDITALKNAQSQLECLNADLESRVIERTKSLEQVMEQLRQSKEATERELAVARALSEIANEGHDIVLLGESITAEALRQQVEQFATDESLVMLVGAPGGGAESIARAIHNNSERQGAFIYVDCSRLVSSSTTLFGVPSSKNNAGKMLLAHQGTLYMEHVNTLSQESQQHFLDYLRGDKSFPNVRILVYSSASLHDMVNEGTFLPELLALLSLHTLRIPSLSERREDIHVLTVAIIERRARAIGKLIEGIDESSLARLKAYPWPGNFEELESLVERSVALTTDSLVHIGEEQLTMGKHVGGYHLESCIGKGGMGEVWLAKHDLLLRPAAVKLVRADVLHSPSQRETVLTRFQREARATAQLRSPHTVELYDFGVQDNGEFFYVMEFLEGMSLQQMVRKHGTLSSARAAFLIKQACYSLAEAHHHGLVHRDIKPGNMMACLLGPHYDFLKVLDLGIVKRIDDASTQVTRTGMIAGTPACLAPELAEQSSPPSAASDIYALGCVAFFLVTGRQPFPGPSVMSVLLAHMTQPVPKASKYAKEVPEAMDKLISWCMAKSPTARPATAMDLLPLAEEIAQGWTQEKAQQWWADHAPGKLDTDMSIPLPALTPQPDMAHESTMLQPKPVLK